MDVKYSHHALVRMNARGITKSHVQLVLEHPDSVDDQSEENRVYSKLVKEETKLYLYRVFVSMGELPMTVISAYKTSKIQKYGYKI